MKKIISIIFYVIALLFFSIYILSSVIFNTHLTEFGRLFLLCSSCLFLYLGGLLLSKCTKTNKPMKINLWIFLILYLVLIITLTLFDPMWGRNGLTITKWTPEMFENYINNSFNIIPFATIISFIKAFNTLVPARTIIYNLLGNFVCMMPFALLLPLLFKKQNKWYIFLITITFFVIFIELTQFITLSGSCDIDDLILNVFGAFLLYSILQTKTLHNFIRNIFLLEKNRVNSSVLIIILVIFSIICIITVESIKYANNLYNHNLNIYTSFYNYKLEIVDDNRDCNSDFELFYEDELHYYYFNCYKSNEVYAVINNDEKYLVKELLNNNPTGYNITMNKLEQAGLMFTKVDKYESITLEFDEIVTFDEVVDNKNIVKLKTDGISYNGSSTKYILYLIPNVEGTTTLEIKIRSDESYNLLYIKRYFVIVDDSLKLKYEEIE